MDHCGATLRQNPIALVIPVERILRLLGIDENVFDKETVNVNVDALRRVLRLFAQLQTFDVEFYAETYPDLEAARMAGVISDLHAHFINSGFLEGRLPSNPPFDPVWYSEHYPDLASVIPASDIAGLRNHFLTTGLVEGRVGTAREISAAAV